MAKFNVLLHPLTIGAVRASYCKDDWLQLFFLRLHKCSMPLQKEHRDFLVKGTNLIPYKYYLWKKSQTTTWDV